jgi:hypothetical protein
MQTNQHDNSSYQRSFEMYQLLSPHPMGYDNIKRINEDGSVTYIPMVEDNTEYQAYLVWLAAGNTPLPAE